MTGMFGSKSKFDEELLQIIGASNTNRKNLHNTVMIFDARPQMNAAFNKGKGGGYEDCGPGTNYPNCKFKFCDIDNIHAVRKSFEQVYALAYSTNMGGRSQSAALMQAIDSSKYMVHVSRILVATNDMVRSMTHDCENVIVHCSDGWDRTSQMAALA